MQCSIDYLGVRTLHLKMKKRDEFLAFSYFAYLSVIAGGFPTVAIDRGASSFATALHIRERYAKYLNQFRLSMVQHNL